jgi:hypothetical protein
MQEERKREMPRQGQLREALMKERVLLDGFLLGKQ